MPRMIRSIGVAAIALAVLSGAPAWAASPADSPVNVPEPEGFWTGPPKAYTPKTLTGATVVDIDALDKLVAAEKPVMIDVAMADQKPVGFPTDRPWLPAHRSIPGSVWMPGAGAAPMAPAREAQFLARVADLTGGDKTKPVVTFCHPECWGSWNAGKRLLQNGYTRVYWFADGVEGWQDRHDTTILKVDAAWAAKPAGEAQR
ncbi:rhodanese-like domain-containing protein [Methylobacterium sp. WCS2018Hpa-22]|uniref:rhodanese-like domain-containing protein n=1 Tax=Methylobacterium sp. WCS2018Hpa-22 TaxID=3073633 RepID=UPI00288BABB8|nr:rhodanese-like domain-containing protein [Methylobacterium sp. WCS2018Hpa-22]